MKSKLQKWGNSLALRIPKAIAQDLNFGQGCDVDITSEEGCAVVKLLKKEKTLDDLLKQITDDNVHGETDLGGPEGKEVW